MDALHECDNKTIHTMLSTRENDKHNSFSGELFEVIDVAQDLLFERDFEDSSVDFEKLTLAQATIDADTALQEKTFGETARKIRGTVDPSIKLGF